VRSVQLDAESGIARRLALAAGELLRLAAAEPFEPLTIA
jgi:hypothetical protein